MEAYLPLIINLVGGAVGGNVAGGVLKNISLGTLGNSIAGILGGGAAYHFLPELLGTTSSLDLQGILTQIAGGAGGGGIIMVVLGLIKSVISK